MKLVPLNFTLPPGNLDAANAALALLKVAGMAKSMGDTELALEKLTDAHLIMVRQLLKPQPVVDAKLPTVLVVIPSDAK